MKEGGTLRNGGAEEAGEGDHRHLISDSQRLSTTIGKRPRAVPARM